MQGNIYWIILLIAIIGEFLLPVILRPFYKRYHIFRNGLGKLSNPKSPVQWVYRVWQLFVGAAMILAGVGLWQILDLWGIPLLVTLILYGAFARIGLSVMSVVDIYDVEWTPTVIYRIFRFSGYFCLQFGVLVLSAYLFAFGPTIQIPRMIGAWMLISSVMGILTYALSRMSRRREFSGTVLEMQGLWELLCMAFLYFPLGVWSVWMLTV